MRILKLAILIFALLVFANITLAEETEIKTQVGKSFKIEVESNPTTGYQWTMEKPVDLNLVVLVSSYFITPDKSLVGAPGKEVWIFKAVKQGSTKIILYYKRPWEKLPPEKQFIFNVTIK